MRKSLLNQHLVFFAKKGFIEFEELLSLKEADLLKEEMEKALAYRLKKESSELSQLPVKEEFLEGRDLWRASSLLRSFATKKNFAMFSALLMDKPSLRLAYDQALRIGGFSVFEKETSLEKISSIQGLVGGLILCLDDPPLLLSSLSEGLFPLPQKKGSGLFFKSCLPLSFSIALPQEVRLYLIAYSLPKAIYFQNPIDPCFQRLKSLDYSFGDRLKDATHPMVYP